MTSEATITFLRTHDLEYAASFSIYSTRNRDGSSMARLTSWGVLWPDPREKAGFGLGEFSVGRFGVSGWLRTYAPLGFGRGYFGRGTFGVYEDYIIRTVTELADGWHVFEVRLRDAAQNIGAAITSNLSFYACARPDTPTKARMTSATGQTMTLAWSI